MGFAALVDNESGFTQDVELATRLLATSRLPVAYKFEAGQPANLDTVKECSIEVLDGKDHVRNAHKMYTVFVKYHMSNFPAHSEWLSQQMLLQLHNMLRPPLQCHKCLDISPTTDFVSPNQEIQPQKCLESNLSFWLLNFFTLHVDLYRVWTILHSKGNKLSDMWIIAESLSASTRNGNPKVAFTPKPPVCFHPSCQCFLIGAHSCAGAHKMHLIPIPWWWCFYRCWFDDVPRVMRLGVGHV